MGTKCVPLFADMLLHAYETNFPLGVFKNKDRKLDKSFNSSFAYIYDVLSLSNSRFGDYLHLIDLNELKVRDTTGSKTSASYHDLSIKIDIRRL